MSQDVLERGQALRRSVIATLRLTINSNPDFFEDKDTLRRVPGISFSLNAGKQAKDKYLDFSEIFETVGGLTYELVKSLPVINGIKFTKGFYNVSTGRLEVIGKYIGEEDGSVGAYE